VTPLAFVSLVFAEQPVNRTKSHYSSPSMGLTGIVSLSSPFIEYRVEFGRTTTITILTEAAV
jgi:hypothetical protein